MCNTLKYGDSMKYGYSQNCYCICLSRACVRPCNMVLPLLLFLWLGGCSLAHANDVTKLFIQKKKKQMKAHRNKSRLVFINIDVTHTNIYLSKIGARKVARVAARSALYELLGKKKSMNCFGCVTEC